ncbi:MAG: hypothetical protein WAT66_04435 [Actinomycetota bacterium]
MTLAIAACLGLIVLVGLALMVIDCWVGRHEWAEECRMRLELSEDDRGGHVIVLYPDDARVLQERDL